MGFYFNYKTKESARKYAIKSFKMDVIIESEDEVEVIAEKDTFYSWLVVQDVISKRKFIEIMFIKKVNGLWGYKFINELQGIQMYDCPLAFLDDANTDINHAWRKQVYLYHNDIRALDQGAKQESP